MKFVTLIGLFILFIRQGIIFAQFGGQTDLASNYMQFNGRSLLTMDYDQDGDVDIIAGGESRIVKFDNLGGDNFGKMKIIDAVGVGSVQSIFAADLDGDGDMDVLSAAASTNTIAWCKNTGGGNFTSQIIISTSANYAWGVHAGDLDGDGDMDVLSASKSDDKIAWYENLGGGTFGPQQIISLLANGAIRVKTMDIDGDGDEDAISASEDDNKIAWYENLGGGSFGSQQIISSAADDVKEIDLVDLDTDGDHDILAAYYGIDQVVWIENFGSGNFSSEHVVSDTAYSVISVYASDIDNDNDTDIIAGCHFTNKKIIFFENNGSGLFGAEQVLFNLEKGPQHLFCADLNADNYPEILSCDTFRDISWHKNNQNLTFGKEILLTTTAPGPNATFPADLDNDGDIDVVVASETDDQVSWFENVGNGEFDLQHDVSENVIDCWSVFAIDLNADNLKDIISASTGDDKVAWYPNLGGGNFGPMQILTATLDGANSVCSFDVDSDGDNDIIAGSITSNEIVWFENLGSGLFGPTQLISNTIYGLRSLDIADLDGDGLDDLISASTGGGTVAWYHNLGSGNFSAQLVISTGIGGAWSVDCGDMDVDGDNDVVVSAAFDNEIVWFENLGTGTFSSPNVIFTGGNYMHSIALGDLDNDSDLDITTCIFYSNEIFWIENMSAGIYSSHLITWTNFTYPRFISTADIDADNDLDLIVSSMIDHTVAYLENNLNNPFTVNGHVYFDNDQNGEKDTGDFGLPGIKIVSTPGSSFATTDTSGNYEISLQPIYFTQYLINPIDYSGWYITSDSLQYHIDITTSNTFEDSLQFGLFPDSLFTSCSSDIAATQALCGEVVTYWLTICNDGTLKHSGVIELALDTNLSLVNSAIPPDSLTTTSLFWHYDSLSFFDCISIPITVEIPAGPSSDTLISILNIFFLDGFGNTTFISSDTMQQILDCVSAPGENYKSVLPAGVDSMGYIPNTTDYLEYTIYFQNNDNDTIEQIIITDQLDSTLDWQSVIVTGGSHAFYVNCSATGELTITSENASLPPFDTDPVSSQGYITFIVAINPNLAPGTTIHNDAEIQFIYNTFGYSSEFTNTTINTIYNCDEVIQGVTLQSMGCENQFINGELPDHETTSLFVWEITGIDTLYDEMFNWLPDTSGTFDLNISVENAFCTADTNLQIIVNEAIPLQLLDSIIVCTGESAIIFGQVQSIQGIFYDTLLAVNGCDSILAKELIVIPPNPINNLGITEICFGTDEIIFGQLQSTAGIYYDTLQTINGCDSVLSQQLIVLPVIPENNLGNVEICVGDSVLIFGLYQSQPGIYYDTLLNINGCDSILLFQLQVNPIIDFGELVEDTLCAYSGLLTLNTGIPTGGIYYGQGVSSDQFDPSAAGSGQHFIYYEYEDLTGCSAIDSIAVFVDQCLGQSESIAGTISVRPNPFSDFTTISFSESMFAMYSISIHDQLGQLVFNKESVTESQIEIYRNQLNTGIYTLSLRDSETGTYFFNALIVIE